ASQTTCKPSSSFFFSSRRRHTRFSRDWSSDVCSSDLELGVRPADLPISVTVTAYARDPERVRLETAAYRARTGGPVGVALRPMTPDCHSAENLAQKLRAAAADRVDFYHYGLSPLPALDLIRRARAIADRK